ncbi:hypothetical protein BH10PSE1_BH10PSE1_14910 [soil metagenome]
MTSSCGMVEGDPHRFEGLAQHVADIRLDGSTDAPSSDRPVRTAAEAGLRPAIASSGDGRLKVEVMDPHDLWDARDAGLRGTIEQVGSRAVQAAAPAVAEAVVQRVSTRMAEAPPMRPVIASAPSSPRTTIQTRTTIQLGAYSSAEAARAAWADVSTGVARNALKGLSPVFEAVQVNGRPFTRLKVAAPATAATAICRAAEVSDPWCARRT